MLFLDINIKNTTVYVVKFVGENRESLKPVLAIRNDSSHIENAT
jgi:hypothetical protein